MKSILLFVLISTFIHQNRMDDVSVEFKFIKMDMGQPPMKMYYYDVKLKNNLKQPLYLAIPRNFDDPISSTDKVWGAQYDDFGAARGSTLFMKETTTIFKLEPNQTLDISYYEIKSFQDKILTEDQTISIFISKEVKIGNYTLEDFMKKEEVQNDNLQYQLTTPLTKKITLKVR